MKQKTIFTRFIQLWGIVFLIGTGASIIAIDVIGSYRVGCFRADQMRTNYIARQKQIIKQEVLRVVDMINYEKEQSTALTRTKIKTRVYEACSIAENIYQQNKSSKTAPEIQQMIIDALRPIRFEHGIGYYFVHHLDGMVILSGDKPGFEGLNLWDMTDTRGQYGCKDMTEIINKSGEGFYEYHWTKPNSAGNDFEKITFVKKIEPYDWYVGAGLYVDDVEKQIKADLLSAISRIRFGEQGYIFINRMNGDVLVSKGHLFSGTKKLWEVFNKNPENMKSLFDKEYNIALKPGGDYIYYSFVKLNTLDKESPKVSFIYGIPDLQWFVGAGVYIDDVENDIALMQGELNSHIKEDTLCFILISMGIIILFLFWFSRFNRRLKNDFNLFSSFFHRAAFSYELIDRDLVQFDELDRMAEDANKMLWERKKTEEELRCLRNYLSNIIDSMPSVIVGLDLDGKVTQWNNAAQRITGISSDAALGLSLEQAFPRLVSEMERVREAIRTREVQIDSRQVRKENGETRYEDVSVYPLVANGVEGTVIRVDDVTEQVRIEEMIVQSEKMLSVGGLAAGMAHEINNPLSGMMQTAEVLSNRLTRSDLPANVKAAEETGITMEEIQTFMEKRKIIDMLGNIRESGSRAAEIVSNMLFFAQKSDSSWPSYHLADLLDQIVELAGTDYDLKKKYDFRRIKIVREYENDLPLVSCESGKIQQVLFNILRNGAEAMQEYSDGSQQKTPCFVLRLVHELEAGMVRIEIEDNGPGMDQKTRKRVFEPFFTTKPTGSGTGIGLSISYFIITENHNGKMSVESIPGEGTKFIISLPVKRRRL
ncbi:cache domain-containing protein [Desulfobacula phenolica]|uniref:histidine kinase n=1 Tax=Desulfobacula phenolica TaxID=90732 RepID=A0A1H2JQY7_9BACT|nr:cache domain-containing protein [Desulfobacula phenolica]SDU58556.1 PAS domain S-box-containing protein [Desulfobacula phenolica]